MDPKTPTHFRIGLENNQPNLVNMEEFVQLISAMNEFVADTILSHPLNSFAEPITPLEMALAAKGIGKRAIIIMTNELIPLKSNALPSVNSSNSDDNVNINFGGQNTAMVTNIVRLIELQNILNKQINKIGSDFIVKHVFNEAAEELILGELSEEQLADAKQQLNTIYNDLRNEVILNFSTYFSLSLTKTQSIFNLINSIIAEEAQASLDPDFLFLLGNMAINDAYINRLKEFYFLLFNFKSSYDKWVNLMEFPDLFNENLNSFVPYFDSPSTTFATPKASQKYFLGQSYNELSSVTSKNNMSNFLNLTGRLVNYSMLLDTRHTTSVLRSEGDLLSYSKVSISQKNDLRIALARLKQINLISLISQQNRHATNKNLPSLKGSDIEYIFSALETPNTNKIKQIGEILSSICYDHVIGANTIIDSNLSGGMFEFITSKILNMTSEQVISGEVETSIFANALKEEQGQEGTLFSLMFGKVEKQNMSTIPSEFKDALLLEIYNNNITTDSFDYFVLKSIEENDLSFTDLKSFLEDQKFAIEDIISGIIKYMSLGFDEKGLNPNDNFSYAINNLNPMSFFNFYLQEFSNDIKDSLYGSSWISAFTSMTNFKPSRIVPHLALAAHAALSPESAVQSFKCSFLGALADHKSHATYLYEKVKGEYAEHFEHQDIPGADKFVYGQIIQMLTTEIYKEYTKLVPDFWGRVFDITNTVGYIRNDFRYNDQEFLGLYDRGDFFDGYPPSDRGNENLQSQGDSYFNQSKFSANQRASFTNVPDLNFNPDVYKTGDYYGESSGESIVDPGIKRYLDHLFTNRPVYGDVGSSTDEDNSSEKRSMEALENASIEDGDFPNIFDLTHTPGAGKKVTGIHFTKQGGLHTSLLLNKALLNNSTFQNQRLAFPDIQNLSASELQKLVKTGYFSAVGENTFTDGGVFRINSNADISSHGPVGTSTLHLSLMFHLFILEVIKETQFISLGVHDYQSDTGPSIFYLKVHIIALMHAFEGRTFPMRQSRLKELFSIDRFDLYQRYQETFIDIKDMIDEVKSLINDRSKKILRVLRSFQMQIEKGINVISQLENTQAKIGNFILRDIATTFSQNDAINLNNFIDQSSLLYVEQSYKEKFLINQESFPLPERNKISPEENDLKIMYKIMTQPGYGFLSSENFGSKKIFHVGIPGTVLQNLYKSANKKSNLICFIVERKNNIDLNEKTAPKYFIYDISKFISPSYQTVNPVTGLQNIKSNHVVNFLPDSSFQSTIDSIEFLELKQGNLSSVGTGRESIIVNTNLGEIENNYDENTVAELSNQIHINHILDYYLKLYTKSTSEFDIKECNFPLRDDVYYENTIDDNQHAVNFYNKIKNNIQNKVDNLTNDNEDIEKQIARMEKIVKTSAIFNSNARAENTYGNTGCFSRIFSFLINDGDFIKYNESEDNNNNLNDYSLGAKLTQDVNSVAVEDSSIYNFTIKVALLKRW